MEDAILYVTNLIDYKLAKDKLIESLKKELDSVEKKMKRSNQLLAVK